MKPKAKAKPTTLQELVEKDLKKKDKWWKRTLGKKVPLKGPYLNAGIEG